jgi:hypothetical protein
LAQLETYHLPPKCHDNAHLLYRLHNESASTNAALPLYHLPSLVFVEQSTDLSTSIFRGLSSADAPVTNRATAAAMLEKRMVGNTGIEAVV